MGITWCVRVRVCVCWNGSGVLLWENVAWLLHCVKELCDICPLRNKEHTEKDKGKTSSVLNKIFNKDFFFGVISAQHDRDKCAKMCSNFKVIFWPILVIVKAAFLKNIYINSGSNYMYRNMYIICSHSRQLNTHCKVDKNRSESMLMSPSLTIHLHKLILKIVLIFWKQTPFVSFDVFVALKWENQIPNWLPSLKSAQLLKQPVVQNGFKLPVFFSLGEWVQYKAWAEQTRV